MTLPYDYARCEGVQHDGEWREGCEDCQRRTSPGRPEGWQTYIKPIDRIIVFECEYRIAPEAGP